MSGITLPPKGGTTIVGGAGGFNYSAIPNIFADDDCGGDIDGPFSTAMLASMHAAGKINLLGINATIGGGVAAPMTAWHTLRYYLGANSVPVSLYNGNNGANVGGINAYAPSIAGNVWGASPASPPSSYIGHIQNYRTIMAAQIAAGTKMTILTTGPLTALDEVLKSSADGISGLTGLQMVAACVSRIVSMGGYGPNSAAASEYNISCDGIGSAHSVQTQLATLSPLIEHLWITYEVGGVQALLPPADPGNPISATFTTAIGGGVTRPGWDATAAAVAILGDRGTFYPAIRYGTCTISASGVATWSTVPGPDSWMALASGITVATANTLLQQIFTAGLPATVSPGVPTISVNAGLQTSTTIVCNALFGSGGAPSSYNYEISSNGGTSYGSPVTGQSATYTFTGLAANTSYLVRVAAVNSAGTSAYSAPATVTTANVITAGLIQGLVLNGSGAGAYSTPNVASVQHGSGLFEMQMLISIPAGSSGRCRLIDKEDGTGGYGFGLYANTLQTYINGSEYENNNSTGLAANSLIWAKTVINFGPLTIFGYTPFSINEFTSSDGITWTPYSVGGYGLNSTALYEATASLTIGANQQTIPGAVIKHVRFFKNGVLTLDVDFTVQTAGALTFTAATGQVFTTTTAGTSFLVANTSAETATITAPSGTFYSGVPISLSGSLANGTALYVSATSGGTEQARVAATVSGNNWTASLTPTATGSTTISAWQAASGGTALATTGAITVGAAPSGTVISSMTIAPNGTTLTMALSQSSTLTTVGSIGIIVGGAADAITWNAPGTAATTFTGTLATAATTGATCTYTTTSTNFTSPALAAVASGVAITNNSTVSAGSGFDIHFAGTPGAAPAGNLALTPAAGTTDMSGFVYDASGNLQTGGGVNGAAGIFQGLGTHGDGTLTVEFGASAGGNAAVGVLFKMQDANNGYFLNMVGNGSFDETLVFYKMVAGSYTLLQNSAYSASAHSQNGTLVISGSSVTWYPEGFATGLTLTDPGNTYTAPGYIGFRNQGNYSISRLAFA